jgi:hypothetical protein
MAYVRSSTLIAAVAICAIVPPAAADINVTRWPDEVPCDAIKRSADGAWVLTTTVIQGPILRKSGETFRETRVRNYWDTKCGRGK